MKKVLLIGKFNEITKELSTTLSKHYQVQLCADNKDILKGMLQMGKPDLAVILFMGTSITPESIFSLLSMECPRMPIIAVGNNDEERILKEEGYLAFRWVCFLHRPANPDKVLKCAEELLDSVHVEKETLVEAADEKKASVLLVDDSPTQLRAMNTMLSPKYKVTFATSGPQAIASIAKSKPDIILLDYEMPVCDGKKTLQMLRSEEDMKDIPVVFLTGISDSTHVMEVMELRPQGYLLKPCTEGRIFSTIESVLKKSAEEREKKEN